MLLNSTLRLLESVTETLGLVNVNFDAIEKGNSIRVIHNIDSDCFKRQIEKEFPDLFMGMEGEISIKLHDGAVPHTEPIRRVSHAMQQPLKDELDKLVKEKILCKVDISEPIEWINSFVYIKMANGKIRLCLDPTHFNKRIICPRHNAKMVDDILHRLNGAKCFTVVDSTSSFLTIN